MPIYRPDYFEDGVYHIYNRGVAKLPTFLTDDCYHDFQDILRYLLIGFPVKKDANLPSSPVEKDHLPVTYRADPQSNGLFRPLIDLLAYCLMPNHFHLLIQLKQTEGRLKSTDGRMRTFQPISELVRRLCITYSHKFNYRHRREGAVFQGRFRIKNVPGDPDVVQVARYIHLNPVPELVASPEQWLFGDYHVYASPGSLEKFQITKPNLIFSYFNNSPDQYREFIEAEISELEAKRLAKYAIDHDLDD